MESPRDKNGLTEQEFLRGYRADRYPRPSMTADILLLSPAEGGPEALLIRRCGHPFIGSWALPGGFVNPNESVDAAATRELLEETHVEGVPLRPLMLCSTPGRDPRTWTISQAYLAFVNRAILSAEADDDADDARWFLLRQTGAPDDTLLEVTDGVLCLTARLRATISEAAEGTLYDITVLESNGIAFDHAAILLRGLMEWEARGREDGFDGDE